MRHRALLLTACALVAATPLDGQSSRCQTTRRSEAYARASRQSAADSVRDAQRARMQDTLTARILAAAREAGIADPAGLVVLERGRGGIEITAHGSTVPDLLLRGVVEREAALLAPLQGRDRVVHLRLDPLGRTDLADSAAVVECRPDLAELPALRRDLAILASREDPLPTGSNPRVVIHVRMLVSREGSVAYAELSRRGYRPSLNTGVLRLAREQRFVPATVAGVPVDVWVELPFHLVMPVARRDPSRPR